MAEVQVAEPVDLLTSKEHLDAVALVLRLGSILYVPTDGLGGAAGAPAVIEWLRALERALPGTAVTYLARWTLSGPKSLYGHERIKIELGSPL